MQYKTTAAFISGAIVGKLWSGNKGGILVNKSLRANYDYEKPRNSFRDVLENILSRYGGDFENAKFAGDTLIRIERKRVDGVGKYSIHVKEIELSSLCDLNSLINRKQLVSYFID